MNEKPNVPASMDLADLRARLAGKQGRDYWRSLEELAETEEFQNYLHREFPQNASEWHDPAGRRDFLRLMAASLALAGLTGCTRQPQEKIVPYVRAPEQFIPGKPLYYATAMTLGGYATGLLVESHMGRPTKIEGNALHPASLGATDAFAQASILTLYDPDRSQVVSEAGRISTWSNFLAAATRAMQSQSAKQGAGLRILTETITSPTLADQIRNLLQQYPQAKWHQYEPINRDNARVGARLAFGEVVDTQYRFDRAKVVLSFESDFLCNGPGGTRYARDFSAARRARTPSDGMNRLYLAESTPSNTGAMADHRLAVRSGEIESIAREVARRLGVPSVAEGQGEVVSRYRKWINAVVNDLGKNRGMSIIIAGETQPPVVHALAHAINSTLGNPGATLLYTSPVEASAVDQMAALRELTADMDAGRVEVLLILGGNPVYTAPADLDFAGKMGKVPLRAHLGLYDDETSFLCHWHVPEAHYLEAWGDARAFDGTVTIQQPLIAPLYGGKSAHELLAALAGQPGRSAYDILRADWQAQNKTNNFEVFWRRSVHDGVVEGTAHPARNAVLRTGFASQPQAPPSTDGLEVTFRPDASIYDGRFANNAWLQELPKSLTKLTWDNVAMVSPATAERLGLRNEDVIELEHEKRKLHAPVWVMPGQADDSVCLQLGYGRKRTGRVGTGIGYDANSIRTATSPWLASSVQIQKTSRRYRLAVTQDHHSMEGRHLVREASLSEFRKEPHFAHKLAHDPPPELTLFPPHEYKGYSWGMTMDLNACVGCSSCVVACQAENNIPIVGKAQVMNSREMHWIRIDRYYQGDLDNPKVYHQPVTCMQCENAPCEVVCPVAATVHNDEGLNDMVYNRCVGTRYCSNNCPYKVRRFNFLKYNDDTTPVLKLLRNPDVTVRTRGVMEKCTYCVQRINEARITAEKEGRQIRDGEIVTACQQVCPTQAITFGNINDPKSNVSRLKASSLNYGILTELNTRPRTTYLAKLTNPNPELEAD